MPARGAERGADADVLTIAPDFYPTFTHIPAETTTAGVALCAHMPQTGCVRHNNDMLTSSPLPATVTLLTAHATPAPPKHGLDMSTSVGGSPGVHERLPGVLQSQEPGSTASN
eukprot:361797-Chlamydomonas_euryale.AAC.4